jgi:hypothetical protein
VALNRSKEKLRPPLENTTVSELIELNLTHKSIVKAPVPKSQSALSAMDKLSPVPSSRTDAPPNLLCAVSTCAFAVATTVHSCGVIGLYYHKFLQ